MTQIPAGQETGPAIALRDVLVSYGGDAAPALEIGELTVASGETVAIIGSSGAGKSTLVRLINGLLAPLSGEALVLGESVTGGAARRREFRRRIGCVFQEYNLVERASVYRNVLHGRLGWTHPSLSLFGWFSETDKAIALRAIEETGLASFAGRRADTLSGGQRQRVAIARALAQEPEVLTADEPVSSLDPVLTADMMALLADAAERRGASLVMIVHHPALARRHAGRILGLRDGRLVFDSATGAALDARAEREIYGRNVPLEPVPAEGDSQWDRDAGGGVSPSNVA